MVFLFGQGLQDFSHYYQQYRDGQKQEEVFGKPRYDFGGAERGSGILERENAVERHPQGGDEERDRREIKYEADVFERNPDFGC